MKINLSLNGSNEPLAGYLNLDPLAKPNTGYIISDISNLNDLVDDGEAIEIRAINIIQYFEGELTETIIRHWLSKLAHNGKLIIGFTEMLSVCKDIYLEKLDIHQVNTILYGTNPSVKSIFTIEHLSNFIWTLGYKIISKRVIEYQAILTVERV